MSDPKRPGDVDPLAMTLPPASPASTAYTPPPGAQPPGALPQPPSSAPNTLLDTQPQQAYAPATAYTPPPGVRGAQPPSSAPGTLLDTQPQQAYAPPSSSTAYTPPPGVRGAPPSSAPGALLDTQPQQPYAPRPSPPAPPAKRSVAAIVIVAIIVTAAAAGIAFAITKLTASPPAAKAERGSGHVVATPGSAAGSAAATGSAAPAADVRAPEITAAGADSIATLLEAEQTALRTLQPFDPRLIASDAFVFGVDATEAAVGADAAQTFMKHDLAGMRSARRKQIWMGDAGTALWIAEQIEVELPRGKRTFSLSQLIDKDHDRYTVRALHWSRPVSDSVAYAAMKAGTLPEPTQLADAAPTDPELEDAVHAAFASHAGYVAALSTRADAFSFGSAGETMQGAKVKQAFQHMNAAFSLHDGARVEQVGTDLAWAVANVDFKNKAGTETFRVLAVFVREAGVWKIALGHWSNGFPIPGAP